jgi:hypothetical protein
MTVSMSPEKLQWRLSKFNQFSQNGVFSIDSTELLLGTITENAVSTS